MNLVNTLAISSFSFDADNFLSCVGSWILDLFHYLVMSLLYWAVQLCNTMQSILEYLADFTVLKTFLNSDYVGIYYNYSMRLGILLVILFGGWQILKRNIEPDKSPPLSSIIFEIVKCTILIVIFSFIFTQSCILIESLYTDIEDVQESASSSSTISTEIIVSFVESNAYLNFQDGDTTKVIQVLTDQQVKDIVADSLNKNPSKTTCGKKIKGYTMYKNSSGDWTLYTTTNVRFWGCENDKDDVAPLYNWRLSKAESESFDDMENKVKAITGKATSTPSTDVYGYLVLDNASRGDSYSHASYIIDCHELYMLVAVIFFTIAFISASISLCTRIFELVILIVLAPAIIGTTVCRQEARGNLWKLLSSFLLESVGTILVLYFGVYFISVIGNLEVSTLNDTVTMVLKMILIVALGMFMMKGSKVIQTFISESAGISEGMGATLGALAVGGAAAGLGVKAARHGVGGAMKLPAGVRNVGNAATSWGSGVGLSHHQKGLANAQRKQDKAFAKFRSLNEKGDPKAWKYFDKGFDQEGKIAKHQAKVGEWSEIAERRNNAGKQYDVNGNRVRNMGNVLSSAGDVIAGNKNRPHLQSKVDYVSSGRNKQQKFSVPTRNN